MTADTPKFGSLPDWEKSSHSMENFGIEMFRCTKSYGDRSKNVNILHVSTDLDGARHEMERIVQFMKKKGFDVRHESISGMRNGMGVDIVIVGSETASHDDARYLIRHISLGFLGLTLWWDVLWYGTDYTPQPCLPRLIKPSCSNHAFSMDGICLAHAHIRRRYDVAALRGAHLTMQIEIEDYIDVMLGTWKVRSVERIEAFKSKVKIDGRWGPDAELFFAALDAIRNSRNTGSHPLQGVPKEELKKKVERVDHSRVEFGKLARKHKRPFGPPMLDSPEEEDLHTVTKWEISIAQMAIRWVAEYSKLYRTNQ